MKIKFGVAWMKRMESYLKYVFIPIIIFAFLESQRT